MGDDMDEWEAAHAAELELEREMYPGMLKKLYLLQNAIILTSLQFKIKHLIIRISIIIIFMIILRDNNSFL